MCLAARCAKCLEVGHRQGDLEATPLKLCQCVGCLHGTKNVPEVTVLSAWCCAWCILSPCFVVVVLTQHGAETAASLSPASLHLRTEVAPVQLGS